MKRLTILADLAKDTLSRRELVAAILGRLPENSNPRIDFVESEFNTYHTSFLLSQIVFTEERLGAPQENVIFVNTDPRTDKSEAHEVGLGALFLVAILKSGLIICGPNGGYCFSMIKEKIEQLFVYRGVESGSQFRSRDRFPQVVAPLMEEKEESLNLEEISLEVIPDLNSKIVAHIDNFGNIKTTFTKNEFEKFAAGTKIKVEINGVKQEVIYTHHLTGHHPGELLFYPGSSGDINNPFMEIANLFSDNYKSASDYFGHPKPGMEVKIK